MAVQWPMASTSPDDHAINCQPLAEQRRESKPSATLDVEIPLAHLTFKGLVPVVVFSVVGMCGTTALLAHRYHDAWLWKLLGVMLALSALRLSVVVAFSMRKGENLTQAAAAKWQNAYALATLPYCATLCASTLYNFGHHELTARALCTLGTFLVCSGLSARVGMRLWAAQLSGLLLLAALALCIMRASDPLLAYNGVALICFFALAHMESVRGKYDSTVRQLRDENKLRELSERDTLTGLANRRFFEGRLEELCRGQNTFATLFLDLDRFKAVNDTHGHAAGDELLRQVSVRLKQAVRSTDLLARLGGDEFAILQTPVGSRAEVESLAGRLNESIGRLFIVHDHEVSIGTSIGIEMSTHKETDPSRLLSAADRALYQVKQMGRGGYRFA